MELQKQTRNYTYVKKDGEHEKTLIVTYNGEDWGINTKSSFFSADEIAECLNNAKNEEKGKNDTKTA